MRCLPLLTCAACRSLLGDKALLGLMRKKGEKPDRRADNKEDAAFDVLTRELVFEAKARPGGRTLTGGQAGDCCHALEPQWIFTPVGNSGELVAWLVVRTASKGEQQGRVQ
jgi:hypothetical protein